MAWTDRIAKLVGLGATPVREAAARASADPGALATARARGVTERIGTTGLKQYGGFVREEFLLDLSGRRGIQMFREMRDNDDVIGAAAQAIESLIRGVDWRFDPVDPNNPDDIEAADFIGECIKNLESGWENTLAEILSMLWFGWSFFEIIYSRRADGRLGWADWSIRAQETLMKWEWDYVLDRAVGMWQIPYTGEPMVLIPFEKGLLFRTTTHKANPEGRSLLRNAYTSYFRKKNIIAVEAIGVERDLAGLPVMYVPLEWTAPDATPQTRQLFEDAKSAARDVKRDEQEGLILPSIYDENKNKLLSFELLSTNSRRQFDTNEIVRRFNGGIASSMLADFILLGQGQTGSFALSSDKTELFQYALTYWLDEIAEVVNRKAISDLLALNAMEGKCNMAHGQVEKPDLKALGDFLQKVTTVGLIMPDEEVETHLRDISGLPQRASTSEGDV